MRGAALHDQRCELTSQSKIYSVCWSRASASNDLEMTGFPYNQIKFSVCIVSISRSGCGSNRTSSLSLIQNHLPAWPSWPEGAGSQFFQNLRRRRLAPTPSISSIILSQHQDVVDSGQKMAIIVPRDVLLPLARQHLEIISITD
jgi:hypothetical protein